MIPSIPESTHASTRRSIPSIGGFAEINMSLRNRRYSRMTIITLISEKNTEERSRK